jgi:hypothetical protein
LVMAFVPVVTAKKVLVSRFKGFTMTLSCVAHVAGPASPEKEGAVMIRAQGSHILCIAIADAVTTCVMRERIEVGLVLQTKLTRYEPSFDDFFSKTIHETLLLPY